MRQGGHSFLARAGFCRRNVVPVLGKHLSAEAHPSFLPASRVDVTETGVPRVRHSKIISLQTRTRGVHPLGRPRRSLFHRKQVPDSSKSPGFLEREAILANRETHLGVHADLVGACVFSSPSSFGTRVLSASSFGTWSLLILREHREHTAHT